MTALIDTIVTLYEFTATDTAALEARLYEQLRLAYLEQIRSLATQHGATNVTPVIAPAEDARLREKARTDAESVAATYNRDLRRQVEAIFNRNPNASREDVIGILASWGRERAERKAIEIGIFTILWATHFGFDLFVSRNNLQNQLFRAVGGIPVCPECIFIVAAGIVDYAFTQLYPLPLHIGCSHEYVFINATDLTARGNVIWLGDYTRAA